MTSPLRAGATLLLFSLATGCLGALAGCEDDVVMEGQEYGCNSQNVPIEEAYSIEFHPNHKGAIVPRVGRLAGAAVLTGIARLCYHRDRAPGANGNQAARDEGVR